LSSYTYIAPQDDEDRKRKGMTACGSSKKGKVSSVLGESMDNSTKDVTKSRVSVMMPAHTKIF
jgi:hypothetical protein